MEKNDNGLNKFRRHRLIKVLFVIITGILVIFFAFTSERELLSLLLIIFVTIIRLIIANLIYHEWIVYIITGNAWNSVYRKLKIYYKKLSPERRNKIIKIVGICIWVLIIIKLIILPIFSNIVSNIGNNILYTANERYKKWWEDITIQEKNKAGNYCSLWMFMKKTSKNFMCLWDLAYYNDSYYEAESYYEDALNSNPKLKDKIDIMIHLWRSQMTNKENYLAKSTLEDTIPLMTDKYADYYDSAFVRIYIGLWLLSDNYTDAISAFIKAEPFAKTNYYKWMFYYHKVRILDFFWYYYDALNVISNMRAAVTLNPTQKQEIDRLEAEIRKKYNYPTTTTSYDGIPTAE